VINLQPDLKQSPVVNILRMKIYVVCCVYACMLDPVVQGSFESPQLLSIN